MVNENLRKRIIERAVKKLAVKPLSILEAVTLQEYIEELEAAQQPLAPDGLHCPVCQQVAGTYLACSYCHSEITPIGKA